MYIKRFKKILDRNPAHVLELNYLLRETITNQMPLKYDKWPEGGEGVRHGPNVFDLFNKLYIWEKWPGEGV